MSNGNTPAQGPTTPPGVPQDIATIIKESGGTIDEFWSAAVKWLWSADAKAARAEEHVTNWAEDHAALSQHIADMLLGGEKDLLTGVEPIVAAVAEAITKLLIPVAGLLGNVSGGFVKLMADKLRVSPAKGAESDPSPDDFGAKYAFDHIVAPIAYLSSSADPTQPGAGATAIQETLGSIVNLHLTTWVVNVLSNVTGAGTLKFMNSFTEVMLSAMNARMMARTAMKPYLNTYMGIPSERELSTRWPQATLSEQQMVKAYIRGALTGDQATSLGRQLGQTEGNMGQFLIDYQKFPDTSMIGKMINVGWIDQDTGLELIKQQGYPEAYAKVVLNFAVHQEVFSILRDAGERLQSHYEQGQIDEATYKNLLSQMMFSDMEIEALLVKAQVTQQVYKKLPQGEVLKLYEEGIVDLNYVTSYFQGLGYSAEDADNLTLLYTASKENRAERTSELAAAARVRAQKLRDSAAVATKKANAALAEAETSLANQILAQQQTTQP